MQKVQSIEEYYSSAEVVYSEDILEIIKKTDKYSEIADKKTISNHTYENRLIDIFNRIDIEKKTIKGGIIIKWIFVRIIKKILGLKDGN